MFSDPTEAVIQTLESAGESENFIRLSTGVVLRGKPANPTTIIKVLASYPAPKPPMWRDPTMGREMENYNDPDYISRAQAWKLEQGDAILAAFILLGTEVVSKPDNLPGHMPEIKKGKGKATTTIDFLDDYSLLNLPMKPQSEKWRYLTWVQTVACTSVEDTKMIQEVVGRLSGVSKKDVQAAEEFPGSEKTA